jgi:hypothetical protein
VTRDELSAFFNRPRLQTAIDFGIRTTALQRLCRKLKVPLPPALNVSGSTLLKQLSELAVPKCASLSRLRISNSAHVCVIGRFPGGPSREQERARTPRRRQGRPWSRGSRGLVAEGGQVVGFRAEPGGVEGARGRARCVGPVRDQRCLTNKQSTHTAGPRHALFKRQLHTGYRLAYQGLW